MKAVLSLGCMLILLAGSPGRAEFTGVLELGPPGCEAKGECLLTYDLRYKDPQGVEWLAAAKDKTDGASIPPWAQPFIGNPFDKLFIKAAAIHDHYCDRHVRPWRMTHRVFYEALLEQGVAPAKAKLMYYAVYLGGPKWVELIPGKPCGKNCVFKIEGLLGDGTAKISSITKQVITRPASYDQPGFVNELRDVEKLLTENGDKVDLEFLEKRAENIRPTDFFYKHGDKVAVSGGPPIE